MFLRQFRSSLQCVQEQLNAEKQRVNEAARETATQAQNETLQHNTETQRLTVRAEAAEAEAARSQQECQRLHSEYDHKVRSSLHSAILVGLFYLTSNR